MDDNDPVYLGDSVYAKIENGVILLVLNDAANDDGVFLEREVMKRLVEYAVKHGVYQEEK